MRTSDIMTSPAVTVGPEAPLREVAAALVERGINAVPVVAEDGRLLGIVSEADLLPLEAAPAPGARAAARKAPPRMAREVMTRPVYTVGGNTDAAAAARLLLRHNLKSVPVVAGGRVVGVVARRDLLRLVARSDQDIRADLERRLEEEVDALQRLAVDVTDGVVSVAAALGPLGRQLLEGIARTVPGVVEVRTSRPATEGVGSAEGDRQ